MTDLSSSGKRKEPSAGGCRSGALCGGPRPLGRASALRNIPGRVQDGRLDSAKGTRAGGGGGAPPPRSRITDAEFLRATYCVIDAPSTARMRWEKNK